MELTHRSSFAALLALALFVPACGDDSDDDGKGKAGAAGSAGSATGGGSGSAGSSGSSGSAGSAGSATGGSSGTAGAGATGGGGGSAGASDAECATLSSAECRQCCGDGHADGKQAYDTVMTDCVCQAATCESQCQQSVCATPSNPGPTPSCNDCLGQVTADGAPCSPTAIQTACTDPGCAGYLTCVAGCP